MLIFPRLAVIQIDSSVVIVPPRNLGIAFKRSSFRDLFKTGMGLDNQTPAEKCGIKIKGNNKWITLIQNASKKT
jgi:hypothetical protein